MNIAFWGIENRNIVFFRKEESMKKEVIEKKMYKGEKLSLSTGKFYKIITEEPRNIEILSATEDGIEDNNTRLFVKSDDGFNK